MSSSDPKSSNKSAPPAEDITLDNHGFAQTAPISDEVPALPLDGDRLRLTEGEVVAGRYRIVRFVAQGGMGEVYEAEDEDLHERVALKTIREETRDAVAEERFKREIQLSRKVTHPNVCRVFDVGNHEQAGERVVFLTMELLGGETLLAQIRREGPLDIPAAGRIVRQIAAALNAAHGAGVVHRDLKSSNVILTQGPDGQVRAVVTDFGLAHVLGGEDHRSLSGSGGIVGTPGYMAPEQVEGGPLSPRTDIYALGVVMFEMLTGKLPFEGTTPLSIAAKRLTQPAPSPKKLRPELPPRWDRAVLACMERDPRDRPEAVRRVLELLEEDGGSKSLRFRKMRRRARLVQPFLAVMLFALAALIGLRAWRARPRALGDELRRRGVSLGAFEPGNAGQLAAYGVLVRNAVRTELGFALPVIDARSLLQLADGRSIDIGWGRGRLEGEPFRLVGRYSLRGDGADRHIELELRIIDPRSNEVRAAVVESGALRQLSKVVIHAGDRLRSIAGIEQGKRRPLQPAGRAALDDTMEAMRDGDLARALELVEQASAAEPDTVELRYVLARVLAGLELDVSSHIAVEHAFALGQAEDPFWAERVEALRLRSDAAHSAVVLEKLFAKHPQNIDVALDLSRVYIQAQRGEDALRLLDRLELQPLQPRERLRIAIERLTVDERLDRREAVARDYPGVIAQAKQLMLPGLEMAVRRIACTVSVEEVNPQRSDSVCGELRTLAERMRLPAGIVVADLSWAGARAPQDSNAQVLERAKGALSLAVQVGGRRRIADALSTFAMAARDTNSSEYDEDLFLESLAIARDAHDQVTAMAALFNLSYYAQADGRVADTIRYLRQASELARDSGSSDMIADAQCRLAISLVQSGDVAGARRLYDDANTLKRRAARDVVIDDCGFLGALLLESEGRYPEARARYAALATLQEKQGGVPAARVDYMIDTCELDYHMRDWKSLQRCANELVLFTQKYGRKHELRRSLVLRALAQAELGHKAEAASMAAFVREPDENESKITHAWMQLSLAALDRRLGAARGELEARFSAVIAVGLSAKHRQLEDYARLERLALLARDADPTAAAEAKDIADRATRDGYIGIAREARAALRGGR